MHACLLFNMQAAASSLHTAVDGCLPNEQPRRACSSLRASWMWIPVPLSSSTGWFDVFVHGKYQFHANRVPFSKCPCYTTVHLFKNFLSNSSHQAVLKPVVLKEQPAAKYLYLGKHAIKHFFKALQPVKRF